VATKPKQIIHDAVTAKVLLSCPCTLNLRLASADYEIISRVVVKLTVPVCEWA